MKRIPTLALALVVAAGCSADKIAGPSGPKETVSLALCSDFRPSFMAIQNEAEAWQAITVPATGPITFDASPKVSIAMTISFFGLGSFTVVFNVTREEIGGTAAFMECEGFAFGDRELNGTVAGLLNDDYAQISASGIATTAGFGSNAWSLPGLPNQSMDLVATRVADPFLQIVDRVIVRRGIVPGVPGSAPIPVLDFGATEALPLTSATLTLSNAGTDFIEVVNTFVTANGTTHAVSNTFGTGASHTFYSVPSTTTITGDLHTLVASASDDAAFRDVTTYFRTAANKSLALGAMVGVPTITTAATSPTRRMRAQVASQTDYPSGVQVTFSQISSCGEGCFTFYAVAVLTSAAFLGGTPATWDVTIPDMSAAGYQAAWGLQNNATPVEWDVSVVGGTSSVALGGTPEEGTPIVSSSRSSASNIGVESGHRTGRVTRRPFVGAFARRK